jgi:AAHS family 4-hydroxybenzoate transporter-like MFS transporter
MARHGLVIDENTRFAAASQTSNKQEKNSLKQLFEGKLAWATPMLWAFYVFSSLALFFIGNWMPQVLVIKGFTAGEASAMVGTSGIFGIAGTILIGLWLDKFGMRSGAVWPLITVACTALIGGSTGAIMAVWICMNAFFMNGGHTILTVMCPVLYPYNIRARGTGLANAAGRVGSIIGPIAGGVMISIGLPMTTLFYFAAAPFVLATIFAWFLGRAYDSHFKPLYERKN